MRFFIFIFFIHFMSSSAFAGDSSIKKEIYTGLSTRSNLKYILPLIDQKMSEMGYASNTLHLANCDSAIDADLWSIQVNPTISFEYVGHHYSSSLALKEGIAKKIIGNTKKGIFRIFYTGSHTESHIYYQFLGFSKAKIGPYEIWYEEGSKLPILNIKKGNNTYRVYLNTTDQLEFIITLLLKEYLNLSNETQRHTSDYAKDTYNNILKHMKLDSTDESSTQKDRHAYLKKLLERLKILTTEAEAVEQSWFYVKFKAAFKRKKLDKIYAEVFEISNAVNKNIRSLAETELEKDPLHISDFIEPEDNDFATYFLLEKLNLKLYTPFLEDFYVKHPKGKVLLKFENLTDIYPYTEITKSQVVHFEAKLKFIQNESSPAVEKNISFDMTLETKDSVRLLSHIKTWEGKFLESYITEIHETLKSLGVLEKTPKDVEREAAQAINEATDEEVEEAYEEDCQESLKRDARLRRLESRSGK